MILVDTSVWIDHFRSSNTELIGLLHDDLVVTHPGVIEEISLGNLSRREKVIGFFEDLHRIIPVSHEEYLLTVRARTLWGRGLGAIDVHLLAAVLVTPGTKLWTRDRKLKECAQELGVAYTLQHS